MNSLLHGRCGSDNKKNSFPTRVVVLISKSPPTEKSLNGDLVIAIPIADVICVIPLHTALRSIGHYSRIYLQLSLVKYTTYPQGPPNKIRQNPTL